MQAREVADWLDDDDERQIAGHPWNSWLMGKGDSATGSAGWCCADLHLQVICASLCR